MLSRKFRNNKKILEVSGGEDMEEDDEQPVAVVEEVKAKAVKR